MRVRAQVGAASQETRALSSRPDHQRSSRLGLDLPDVGYRQIGDRNPARLHGFRNLSSQIDLEQAIVEPCSLDPDVVSQIELPPEGPR